MNRPRIERPVVRDLAVGGRLELLDGSAIPLDGNEWTKFLATGSVFGVEYPYGTYLVTCEKRTRGTRYRVARAYWAGRREAVYLGRTPTATILDSAAQKLTTLLTPSEETPVATPPPPDLEAYLAELLAQETDPGHRAAIEALARLVGNR